MPEEKIQLHEHPNFAKRGPISGRKLCVIGRKLVPGDIIEESDLYASTSYEWLPAPSPGTTFQKNMATVFVRPV